MSEDDKTATGPARGHLDEAPHKTRSSQDAPVRLKRFYTDVSVRAATCDDGATAHEVCLDGRTVKTPARRPLHLPTKALADAIAQEWIDQGEHIDPHAMPLTKLSNTTIDGILPDTAPVRAEILSYVGQDLICYRAEHPAELADLQSAAWDPLVRWAHQTFESPLTLTTGVMPVPQPEALLTGAETKIAVIEPWCVGAVHVITTLTGSAILALAHADQALDADAVWTTAHVDEDWQISQWGADAEAAKRRAFRGAEMRAASQFMTLCRAT